MNKTDKQPLGVWPISAAEMWERYGYWVLQAFFVYYVTQVFNFSEERSFTILGSFSALTLIMPLLGGVIADKLLGFRHSIILGGLMLILGYGMLTLPGENVLMISLAVISVGTGLFKPNAASLLGTLYSENDPRRDSGFTIYYIGINIGALLAMGLSGFIQEFWGWSITFYSTATALTLSVITFIGGRKYFAEGRAKHKLSIPLAARVTYAYLVILLCIALCTLLMENDNLAIAFFFIIAAISAAIVITCAIKADNKIKRNHILAFLLLTTISIAFWAVYGQIFMSMNMFSGHAVKLMAFGIKIPTPMLLASEGLGILTFGAILSRVWVWLKHTKYSPSTPMKFTFANLALAAAFGFILLVLKLHPAGELISLWWVVITFMIVSIAELCLSPIGLAMTSELIPQQWVGMMMGIWYVATGLGTKIAGKIASIAAIPRTMKNVEQIDQIYTNAFISYALMALTVMMIALIFTPWIKKLMANPEK